jgi:predicted amidohydrolase/ribosomal protein S18 acetylase RimI-like enzyme
MPHETKAKLIIRNATTPDIPAIAEMSRRIYAAEIAYNEPQIRGQINNFPEGVFVAEYEGIIVGYCATSIVDEKLALRPHTWDEVSGAGYGSRHNPEGDILYGIEVSVHPDFRRLRIGQRFYRARRELCRRLELKAIVFGGRLPAYQRRKKEYPDPKDYLAAVLSLAVRDQVINFQLKQGFEAIGILKNYLPADKASGGHAVHMMWSNPLAAVLPASRMTRPDRRLPNKVRVATVQFQMRKITCIEEFEEQVEYFVDVASDHKSDFVTFPELFTTQLLQLETEKRPPHEMIEKIAEYTPRFKAFMERLAVSYNINIIGGSHLTKAEDGSMRNTCFVFLRDGAVYAQDKLHPTPGEREWWNLKGGDRTAVIPTDCGPIGVMICYDSEFPELARVLADQGALMLFVPFCTNERRGYMRVRYCCHARAIENQCYMILSGVVGNLPNVDAMDVHYAESCILTPSDFPFARDGVAADTAPNTETIAIADLVLADLLTNRASGTTRNFADRRFDLYQVRWAKGAPLATEV